MEKTLVSFELAKAAKNKGFNLSENVFWEYEELCKGRATYNWNAIPTCYSAPTQSLLAKWLREKHNIFVTVDVKYAFEDHELIFGWKILILNQETYQCSKKYNPTGWFNTYEEALEDALREALNYIVNG